MIPKIDDLDDTKGWLIPFDARSILFNKDNENKFNYFIEQAKKRFNVIVEYYNGGTVPYDVITLEPKKK